MVIFMNKKLYADKGFLNYDYIFEMSDKHNCPYIMIVGGRGVGKTYGALKYLYEHDINYMFMRRTQTQLDMISKNEVMPYAALNQRIGSDISTFKISKYITGFYHTINEDKGKLKPSGEPIAICCALSTISNLRGFDASRYNQLLLYDEFIPERHERPIKEEGNAFLNAIETIARNKEIEGDKPMKVLCLANANNISNPIFLKLKLVNIADNMIRKGEEIRFIENKGVMLIMLHDSPISKQKADTSLYKLSHDTDFEDMALHNNFAALSHDVIAHKNLKEYRLIVSIGEIAIYKHKSRTEYYVSSHVSGSAPVYELSETSLRTFRIEYNYIWIQYCISHVLFESYTLQVLFEKYYKKC